jgi:hypothetical protein
MAGNNSVTGDQTVTFTDNLSFDGTDRGGALDTDGQLWIGSTTANRPGNKGHVRKGLPTINANGNLAFGPGTITINPYNTAKWIVDQTANIGTHTTITAALAAASSGETIFIRPGTYTENLTLKAGVYLTGFNCDSTDAINGANAHVIIVGKLTFTTAGAVNISNVLLRTNGDNFLAVTGSAASQVTLYNCYLDVTNATGISFTSSSGSALITMYGCTGNVAATRSLCVSTSSGNIAMYFCNIFNASTSAMSTSTGVINIYNCVLYLVFSTSGSGLFFARNSTFDTSAVNTTILTTAGTGTLNNISNCGLNAGTAVAVSVGVNTIVRMNNCGVNSTNTNAISGAGWIVYSNLYFQNTVTINTTTQTGSGTIQGSVTTAPSSGFLGEQIRSAVTGIVCANATPRNLTSISLTAGIWDVSANSYCIFTGNCTAYKIGISATSATFLAADGDSQNITGAVSGANAAFGCAVPSYRVTITATTTYYLVAQANFSTGTGTADGRISATRVG